MNKGCLFHLKLRVKFIATYLQRDLALSMMNYYIVTDFNSGLLSDEAEKEVEENTRFLSSLEDDDRFAVRCFKYHISRSVSSHIFPPGE